MKTTNLTKTIVMLAAIFLTACSEGKDQPTPAITLSQNQVTLTVDQTKEIVLNGGDGQFVAEARDATVVDAKISKNKLTLTGKKTGETVVKISSGNALAILKVTVLQKKQEAPLLQGNPGIWIGSEKILETKIMISSNVGHWLCQSTVSPYGNRFFIATLPGDVKKGDEIELKVQNDGITAIASLIPTTSQPIKKKFIVEYTKPHIQLKLKDSNLKITISVK